MRFINGITLALYTLVFFIVGGLFIVISLNLIPEESIIDTLNVLYSDGNIRLILGLTGLLLLFISVIVVQITAGTLKRERTIAFENPDGQVTLSLTAIEDFIKRALKQLPEVKELKPVVRAGAKGIAIINRVTLYSDVNIPDTTEKIQSIVKNRVQEMLGVEEAISIKVHVVKIVHKDDHSKEVKKDDKGQHFRGSIEYGRY